MDDDQVMNVLRAFGKAFNKGDVEAILECVTDDFEWRLAAGPDAPDGKVVTGKGAVREALAERDESTKSMRFSETSVHIAGNSVFGCFRATGELADGAKIDKRGVDIYQFRDGKIAVKDSYWKHIT
ncbi:MAG: nuclear transport factor 2 family protein [Proteobacteria bacterium]|nr:nuclear transport factor 2 family protein [Pseudomonadota bacterium]